MKNSAALLSTTLGLTMCIAQSSNARLPHGELPTNDASSASGQVALGLRTPRDPNVIALIKRTKENLVVLKGGTFDMGDWGNAEGVPYDAFAEGNNQPVHRVTLDGFSMMAYKVSYEDFDLFTDATAKARIDQDPLSARYRAARKPAGVNWYGAKAYCQWLKELTGLPFDLPTEAQWEYAARSEGKKVLFATDTGALNIGRNYPQDTEDTRTPNLGSYPPNPIGLYGMLDLNASGWVNDWYDPNYYKHSPTINPTGPITGKPAQPAHPELGPAKVIRGQSSPGNNPALGGFVFSRGANEPREIRNKSHFGDTGFSGLHTSQFRCVSGSPQTQN